jgi:CHAT domain-containing protein
MNRPPIQVVFSDDELTHFLLKALEILENSQDGSDQIDLLLRENQDKLNDQLLEIFPIVAEQFLNQENGRQIYKAFVLVNFSNLIRQFPLGIKWINQELAIIACQLALRFFTQVSFPEQWAGTQHHLANAYRQRIRGNQAENIERAIDIYEKVLKIYTRKEFPTQWAGTNHNLANAYRDRIRGNQAKNIDKAIVIYGEVLEVYTQEAFPDKWAMTQNNLANAYRLIVQDNQAENIERVIVIYEKILEEVYTRKASPWDWAMTKHNLAAAYCERIRGDRAENLECSIAAYEESLKVYTRTASAQDWAMTKNALGNTYADRIRGNRSENIESSIDAYKQALKIRTRKMFPQDWAMTKDNLGSAYRERIKGDRAENLENAIGIYKQSLQVYTRKNFPEKWAMANNNLANVYRQRIREDRSKNIEQAIDIYKEVLEVYTRTAFPLDWAMTNQNLGAAYHEWSKGNHPDRLECANQYYQASLEIYQPESFPLDCRRTAKSLGNLHFQQKNWQEATKAYSLALAAAETLYKSCELLYSKAADLEQTANLPRRAAYAFAKTGDLQSAVLAIETNRARGLSESLDRDRANLQELAKIAPGLESQYQDITQQLRNIEAQQRQPQTLKQLQGVTPEKQRNIATNLREKLTETIEQIRQQSGYEDFLLPPTIEDIFTASQSQHPIIYLIPTPNGSLALIVMPQNIFPVWIDDFTETNLQDLFQAWLAAYLGNDRLAWQQEIDRGTQILWQVMEPIVDWLQSHNLQQAILIPNRFFSFFPLHAAWKEDPTTITKRHYALDSICFSYAPNTRSITECRSIADRVTPDTLLAIDEPTHQGAKPLPNSSREVASAISTFTNSIVLRHQEATRQATLDALSNTTVWHCSCHGNVNFQTPLDSGLNMAGEGAKSILTLRDILAIQLTSQGVGGIRLTVLSACETGLPGLSNLDEVTSFPIGLLQAGVAGVVASLWSVDELSTMILLSRFYTLWQTEKMEPPIALRIAQQWLRDAEPIDIIEHCSSFIPDLDRQKELICDLRLDYSDPYHWAAFSYTGV